MSAAIRNLVESKNFNNFIILIILINSVVIGMETYHLSASTQHFLKIIDQTCLSIYVVEMLLKLYVYHLSYFKSGWNWLDFTIVVVALSPLSSTFSIFRMLRILRALRLLSMVPAIRRVVNSLLYSIPGVSTSFGLLLIIFYIFGVIAVNLFGAKFPEWFGTLQASLYTLFQIMTLESWSMGIARPVMEQFPSAWIFFIPFILLSTFMILNFVIGLIVDSVQFIRDAEKEETKLNKEKNNSIDSLEEIQRNIDRLQQQFNALSTRLKK